MTRKSRGRRFVLAGLAAVTAATGVIVAGATGAAANHVQPQSTESTVRAFTVTLPPWHSVKIPQASCPEGTYLVDRDYSPGRIVPQGVEVIEPGGIGVHQPGQLLVVLRGPFREPGVHRPEWQGHHRGHQLGPVHDARAQDRPALHHGPVRGIHEAVHRPVTARGQRPPASWGNGIGQLSEPRTPPGRGNRRSGPRPARPRRPAGRRSGNVPPRVSPRLGLQVHGVAVPVYAHGEELADLGQREPSRAAARITRSRVTSASEYTRWPPSERSGGGSSPRRS